MMTKPNEETVSPVHLIVDDHVASKGLRGLRLIALGVAVQTFVVLYLAFWQPAPKLDGKLLNLSNNLMDQEARLILVERENAALFRLLRNENDQRGVVPDRVTVPEPTIPLPPSPIPKPPKRTGEIPGDLMGDMPDT